MMLMFWIFALTDLFVVGIFYAVYGGKRKYAEGMLLGVHIPQSAADSEEVKVFMERYRKNTKRFYLWNGLAGVAVCFLNFWYLSVFMIVWSVWLVEFCAGAIYLLCRTHRKLYDLKVERGWVGSAGSRIMAVDTKVAAQNGKMGLSPWWHLLFLALILISFLDPGVRRYLQTSEDGWTFPLIGILVCVGFGILHFTIMRTRNRIYSEDSELNVAVNRMQKTLWSWAMVVSSLTNAAAYLVVASYMGNHNWLNNTTYAIYIVLQTLPGGWMIGSFLYMRYKKEKMLEKNEEPLYIDDDVYWKNGWYYNPSDKRFFVQDWACSWNYTTNMAKTGAKIFTGAAVVLTAGCLIWVCVLMWKIDFTPIELTPEEGYVQITSGYSDLTISSGEIESVEVLDSVPEDRYNRVNGSDDGRQLLGKFKGRETGKCRMYLYVGYEPILAIQTEKYGPVYVNSKTSGEVEEWCEKITQMME